MIVVRALGRGQAEVCCITGRQTLLVYSSAGAGDDVRQAISGATDWAALRQIKRIYLDAGNNPRDDARHWREQLSRRLSNGT